jgi:hypothetical protein
VTVARNDGGDTNTSGDVLGNGLQFSGFDGAIYWWFCVLEWWFMNSENSKTSRAVWFLTGITTTGMIFFASLYFFAPKTVVQQVASGPTVKTNALPPPPNGFVIDSAAPKPARPNPFDQFDSLKTRAAPARTNEFGDVKVTPPPVAELSDEDVGLNLPVVKVTGFVNVGNVSKVLFVSQPKDNRNGPIYYSLAEGDRSADGKLELVKIHAAMDAVDVINEGTLATLTVKDNSLVPTTYTPAASAALEEAQAQALDEARRDNDLLLKWSLEDAQLDQQWLLEDDLQDLNKSVRGVRNSIDWASQQQSLDLQGVQDSIDRASQQQFLYGPH